MAWSMRRPLNWGICTESHGRAFIMLLDWEPGHGIVVFLDATCRPGGDRHVKLGNIPLPCLFRERILGVALLKLACFKIKRSAGPVLKHLMLLVRLSAHFSLKSFFLLLLYSQEWQVWLTWPKSASPALKMKAAAWPRAFPEFLHLVGHSFQGC